jgi:integrase
MPKRIKTSYPGVYYREIQRRSKKGVEKVYYIVFKQHGRMHEEKVGRQFEDDMTPAKATYIRGQRIDGKRLSRKQMREVEEANGRIKEWTIERLWDEYKNNNPNLKGLAVDENRFKNYVGPHFGGRQPGNLSPFDVDKLRVGLLKEKKPATVRNILELLRRIIRFGEKKQLCPGITFTIQMPSVNNIKTEDLSPEELIRLLNAIEQESNVQIANFMKLALFTGMRRGELFNLKWSDIDSRNGFIAIHDPKGGEDQKIPMNMDARQILDSHPRTKSPYVFPGRTGNKRTDINKQVKRIKEQAGLPKSFRALHGLRHVYASILASSGKVDMYTLQKLLTHKGPAMTQRYAHLRDDALKSASNLIGEIIKNDRSVTNRKENTA